LSIGELLRVRSEAVWYILWSALLLISAGNTLSYRPIFSGSLGFLFTVLLVTIAAMQLLQGALSPKETVLARVLLGIFGAEQAMRLASTLELPPLYRGFDFSAYYLAAKVLSATPGRTLYDLPLYADGRMNLNASAPFSSAWQAAVFHYQVPFAAPFIYPPFFALVMKPLAYLSFDSALIAWQILTVLLLGAAVVLSLKLGGIQIGCKLALILGVGLFSFYPFDDGLFRGQVDCLILFLLTAGVWLLTKNQTLLSALSFAVATLLKLTPVLAIPVLIVHRRWKWLAAYAAWMCCLLLLSIDQAGWAVQRQFWRVVLPAISCGAPICQNSSLVAYLEELFLRQVPNAAPVTLPPHACAVSRVVTLTVYALFLVRFYLRRRDGELVRDLGLMILLELAVSPISWWHHYTIALLPFLYLWSTMPRKRARTLLALVLIVGTNIVGYALLLKQNHVVQLILAAIVPGLTLLLVYVTLAPRRGVLGEPDDCVSAQDGQQRIDHDPKAELRMGDVVRQRKNEQRYEEEHSRRPLLFEQCCEAQKPQQ
jgi:alpha-1,2-mannosyltransferase